MYVCACVYAFCNENIPSLAGPRPNRMYHVVVFCNENIFIIIGCPMATRNLPKSLYFTWKLISTAFTCSRRVGEASWESSYDTHTTPKGRFLRAFEGLQPKTPNTKIHVLRNSISIYQLPKLSSLVCAIRYMHYFRALKNVYFVAHLNDMSLS